MAGTFKQYEVWQGSDFDIGIQIDLGNGNEDISAWDFVGGVRLGLTNESEEFATEFEDNFTVRFKLTEEQTINLQAGKYNFTMRYKTDTGVDSVFQQGIFTIRQSYY